MRNKLWIWGGYGVMTILFTLVLSHLAYHGYHQILGGLQSLVESPLTPQIGRRNFLSPVPITIYLGVGLVVSLYTSLIAYRTSRSLGSLDRGQHGTARWATKEELRKQYDSIPMGSNQDYDRPPGVVVSMEKRAKKLYIDNSPANNLIIGTTRSGKGETFIFPSIDALTRSTDKPSLVINDPKGEFVASASETLQQRGYRIEVLNISDPTNSMRYNPLKLVLDAYKRGAIDEAELLCDTLTYSIFKDDDGNRSDGSFFADSSKALTNAVILAIVQDCLAKGEEEKITLYTVASFMTEYSAVSPTTGDSAMDLYFDSLPAGSPAKNQYAQLRMSEGKTRASILSNTMSKLTQFTLTNIAQMTATQDFDMSSVGFPKKERYQIEAVFRSGSKLFRAHMATKRDFLKEEAETLMKRLHPSPEIQVRESTTHEAVEPLDDQTSLQHFMYQSHDIEPEETNEILDSLLMQGYITDYRATSRYFSHYSKVPYLTLGLQLAPEEAIDHLQELLELAHRVRAGEHTSHEQLYLPAHLVKSSEQSAKLLMPLKAPARTLTTKERLVFERIIDRFLQAILPPKIKSQWKVTVDNLIQHELMTEEYLQDPPVFSHYELVQQASDHPVAIFMVTPDYDKSKHFLASTFVRQLYYVLAKNASMHPERKCDRQVHFILDEFGSMPVIESMDSIITVCLSRNIRFSLVVQSYQQLEDRYKSVGAIIKENCSNTIYILSNDVKTCEDISRKCGEYTMVDYSRSGSHLSISKSESESASSKRLILIDDLLRMPIHQSIVLRATKRTDLKGRPVENHPIFNRGDLELLPRWKNLTHIFPDGNDTSVLIRQRYRGNTQVNLKELHFELEPRFNRLRQSNLHLDPGKHLMREIIETFGEETQRETPYWERPEEATSVYPTHHWSES